MEVSHHFQLQEPLNISDWRIFGVQFEGASYIQFYHVLGGSGGLGNQVNNPYNPYSNPSCPIY